MIAMTNAIRYLCCSMAVVCLAFSGCSKRNAVPLSEATTAPEVTVNPEEIVRKCFDNIRNNEGSYFENVIKILNTQGGVPALIALLDSTDQETVFQAHVILSRISVRLSEPGKLDSELPKDAACWTTWWKTTGSKMTPQTMVSHFNSYWK